MIRIKQISVIFAQRLKEQNNGSGSDAQGRQKNGKELEQKQQQLH